jgi:hypothetical protein
MQRLFDHPRGVGAAKAGIVGFAQSAVIARAKPHSGAALDAFLRTHGEP